MLYKLEFYVPASHVDVVKEALFAQGAGSLGAYQKCSWSTLGTGQFYPLPSASPHEGQQGTLSIVEELKVEMLLEQSCAKKALHALQSAHPYEEVPYFLTACVDTASL